MRQARGDSVRCVSAMKSVGLRYLYSPLPAHHVQGLIEYRMAIVSRAANIAQSTHALQSTKAASRRCRGRADGMKPPNRRKIADQVDWPPYPMAVFVILQHQARYGLRRADCALVDALGNLTEGSKPRRHVAFLSSHCHRNAASGSLEPSDQPWILTVEKAWLVRFPSSSACR
jgi:hypothetical protein